MWTTAQHWMGRRVLVTGASGFVGTALCHLLMELGAEVHGTFRARPCPAGVVDHPLNLPADVDGTLTRARPSVVFHLASPVDLSRAPEQYPRMRAAIVDGSDQIARWCLRNRVRLLYVGTCEEYGQGTAPFHEDQALQPVSAYSALKAAAGHWVGTLSRTQGLQATVVRPFRAYGPGDHHSVVAQAGRAALEGRAFPMTSGEQVREFNHVDAIAWGMVAAAAHPEAIGALLNLGGGERRSVRSLVEQIFAAAGASADLVQAGALPHRAGEVAQFYADTTRSDALFGSLPNPPLAEGLADTLAWLSSHRATR